MSDVNYAAALGSGQNPLAIAQGAIALKQAMLQNKMLQQQEIAKRALGPILQNSIDPTTGQLDYNKAFISMSANPATAWMAPEFLEKAIARQNTQADTALKGLEIAQKRATLLGSSAAALNAKGLNVTRKDVLGVMADLRGQGVFPDAESYLKAVEGIPAEGGQVLADWVKQKMIQGQTAADAMKYVSGELNTYQAGGQTITQRNFADPTRAPRVEQVVAHTPSADSWNQIVEGTTAAGVPYKVPRAMMSPMFSASGERIGGGSPSGTGGAASAPAATPGVAGAQAPGPSQDVPAGAVRSGQSPFEQERSKAAGEYSKQLNDTVDAANVQLATLHEIQNAMAEGKVQGGAGAETAMWVAQLAQRAGLPSNIVDKISNGDLGAMETAKNLLFKVAVGQMRAELGSGQQYSNMELQNFVDSKASLSNDPRAFEKMLGYYEKVIGLKQREQQQFEKWVERGNDPAKFRGAWTKFLLDQNWIKNKPKSKD